MGTSLMKNGSHQIFAARQADDGAAHQADDVALIESYPESATKHMSFPWGYEVMESKTGQNNAENRLVIGSMPLFPDR